MSPYLALGLAVVFVCFGSILVRWAAAPAVAVSFYRIFLASLIVAPATTPSLIRSWRGVTVRQRLVLLASGVALALHFGTWIASLSYTSVAASVLLVNTAPVVTIALAWALLREPPTRAVLVATTVAVAGVGMIAFGDWSTGPAPLKGDLLALAGAVTLSVYHVVGRGLRDTLPLGAYVLAVWATAAAVLALWALVAGVALTGYPPRSWVAFLALALVPTVVGHGLVNRSLRLLPAPVVGLFLLGEPVGAALLALVFLGEVPGAWTLVGGLLVLAALAALVRRGNWRTPREATGSSSSAAGPAGERGSHPSAAPGRFPRNLGARNRKGGVMYRKAVVTCSLFFLASLSLVCQLGFAGPAQVPLRVEDALGVLALANRMPIAMSPDGEWVAYTLKDDRKLESTQDERYSSYTRTGAFTEGLGCDVWMTNTRSGQSRNLTEGKGTASSPVWSPDGKYLAFYSDRSGTFHVWLWERASGKIRQLSGAIARPFFNFQVVRWTPDSRYVLAKVLPEGMTVEQAADLLDPPSTAASEATQPTGVTVKVFSSPAAGEKGAIGAPSEKPVTDESWMNRYSGDLALIEVATGTVRHVATGIKPLGYWVSPDGTHLAYLNWKGIEDNTQQPVYELSVLSFGDQRSRVLVPKLKQDYGISVSWAPDSGSVAYTTSDNGDCYVVRRDGGEPRNLTRDPHPQFNDDHRAPLWDASGKFIVLLSGEQYGRLGSDKVWVASPAQGTFKQITEIPDRVVLEVLAPVGGGRFWSPDGRSMIVMTRHERTKDLGFYKVDVSSGATTLLFEEPRYSSGDRIFHADVSRDGKILAYVAEDAQHPEDIWVSGPDLRDRRQLTHINPQIESMAFGKSRIIDWRGIDGQPLRGALLLPANYEEGKRYPLIVNVYGGSYRSTGVYRFGLSGSGVENLQILATRGYAVLLPDTPLRKGTPMQDLLKTVMPGVDRAVDLGIADPERLGVMGHSYGGYSTLSLIVQTTRFKAAVDSAGPANLLSFYGVMHKSGGAGGIGWSETGQGGMVDAPWQVRDRYIENSPWFYLDRVETPLLIIQGTLDLITLQSDEVFVALRRLGKEVVYAKYAGEDHWEGTWSAANVADYWTRVIGWFETHLSTGVVKKQD